MSVPRKNSTWGDVLYKGEIYGVLDGFQLSEEMWKKYEQYSGNKRCIKSTAPWSTMKVSWSIEEDNLYLTELCGEGLLTELFGKEKILADWVDEMKLLVKHQKVCKTYEKKNSYLNEMDILYLSLNQGDIVDMHKETELYTSIEMKNYIDSNPAYATLRIDSMDLLEYLKNEDVKPVEDQILPVMSNIIDQMIQKGSEEDISLGIEDISIVLKEGELAVFASAKGSNIDEMVGSLIDSMTDEVLKAKGCLIHLTMNKAYSISNIESIVNSFENKLGFDKEDQLDAYIPNRNPFIFGTRLSDEIEKNEVLIQVLLCI